MPRTMYDGINPGTVIPGADVYAGYINGSWPDFNTLVAEYPAAEHVSVSVFSAGNAQVLDVENGDASAADVPGWLNRQRSLGAVRPTIYCSRVGAHGYGWQDIINACNAAGVAQPDYWIADYTGAPHTLTLDGIAAAAVQWADAGGFDESAIYDDTWPLAATPVVPVPVPPSPTGGSTVLTVGQALHEGQSQVAGVYSITLQTDGNLVIYKTLQGQKPVALWSTGTGHTSVHPGPFFLTVQTDGNCVLYDVNGHYVWASGTSGLEAKAIMQTDGNWVVYTTKAGFASNTGGK